MIYILDICVDVKLRMTSHRIASVQLCVAMIVEQTRGPHSEFGDRYAFPMKSRNVYRSRAHDFGCCAPHIKIRSRANHYCRYAVIQ